MTTDNKPNTELPWLPEEEHTIWMSFVVVADDRRAAYDKVNKWCDLLGKTGNRPEDCIQYGADMVEREWFPKAAAPEEVSPTKACSV